MKVLFTLLLLLVVSDFFSGNIFAKVADLDIKSSILEPDDTETDHQRIIAGIKRAIEADPEDYENYTKLAFVYDYIGDYKNELNALELEVKYMPQDLGEKDIIYGNLARAYILNNRIDEAEPWLIKADRLNPKNIINRWLFLTCHMLKDNHKMAAQELKRLQKLGAPGRDYYYEAYIFVTDRGKSPESVIKLFKEAVKANPKSPLSHRALGIAIRNSSKKLYKENMPEVMKELETALKLDPKYVLTYITIGDTYLLLASHTKDNKYFDEALSWFDKGYEVNPNDTRLAFATGHLFYYMKDYDRAIKKLEFAYQNNLKDDHVKELLAGSYNNRAYEIYQSGKDLEYGLGLINKAIELSPNDGIILGTKAEILYKLSRYKEAYKYIKQALELEPGHKEMRQDMASIEEALKNPHARRKR